MRVSAPEVEAMIESDVAYFGGGELTQSGRTEISEIDVDRNDGQSFDLVYTVDVSGISYERDGVQEEIYIEDPVARSTAEAVFVEGCLIVAMIDQE